MLIKVAEQYMHDAFFNKGNLSMLVLNHPGNGSLGSVERKLNKSSCFLSKLIETFKWCEEKFSE